MFGFGKKKVNLQAVCSGELIGIESVNDPVFSQKMLGDGVAIKPQDAEVVTFCSPVAGTIRQLFKTRHAFVVRSTEGLDVLVHIGMDTVGLKGEGFEALVEQGAEVAAGTPVIAVQAAALRAQGVDLTTPVVLSEKRQVDSLEVAETGAVAQGDAVATVKLA